MTRMTAVVGRTDAIAEGPTLTGKPLDQRPTSPAIRVVPIVYLDELETALYLKVKPNTLRGWRVKGGGPRFRQHGTSIVYAISDCDAWSEGRAKLSTSDVSQEAGTSTT